MATRARAISLYRSLLRAHKKHLPTQMRDLGDTYVKSEFRLHKTAKPEHVTPFLTEWEQYLEQILMTARAQGAVSAGTMESKLKDGADKVLPVFSFGSDLPHDVELTDEQVQQLQKLREEALKASGK